MMAGHSYLGKVMTMKNRTVIFYSACMELHIEKRVWFQECMGRNNMAGGQADGHISCMQLNMVSPAECACDYRVYFGCMSSFMSRTHS